MGAISHREVEAMNQPASLRAAPVRGAQRPHRRSEVTRSIFHMVVRLTAASVHAHSCETAAP